MSIDYIGLVKNNFDKNNAIALASLIFKNDNHIFFSKKNILSVNGDINRNDIVIIKKNKTIIGCCFLIERYFILNHKKIKGIFLSSICILKKERGNGYSIPLLKEAIKISINRGAKFSILIARRNVDYFYNKLSFWGLSQYTKIIISKIGKVENLKKISFKKPKKDELKLVDKIYSKIYLKSFGPCIRSITNWKYILKKTFSQKINFKLILINNVIEGYIIYKSNLIFELALKTKTNYILVLSDLIKKNSIKDDLIIHSSDSHPVIKQLYNSDFSIQKRQCLYGGHMLRINEKETKKISFEDTVRKLDLSLLSKTKDDLESFSFNLQLLDEV